MTLKDLKGAIQKRIWALRKKVVDGRDDGHISKRLILIKENQRFLKRLDRLIATEENRLKNAKTTKEIFQLHGIGNWAISESSAKIKWIVAEGDEGK